MVTSRSSVIIAPSFLRSLRIILTVVLVIVVFITLVASIRDEAPFSNLVKHWSTEETIWSLTAIGVVVFCAAVVSAIGKYSALVVDTNFIYGRTENGQRIKIPTTSVLNVELRPNPTVQGFYVSSSSTDERLFAILWGVDIQRISKELDTTIGPTHKLARWFQEHAT